MTPEAPKAQSRRAANASAIKRRADVGDKTRTGLDLGVSLEDVLAAVAPALEAILETGEPDWSARLAAAGTLLIVFPRQFRDTPEHVRETLECCLPQEVLDQAGMRERLDVERVHRALRAEWLRLRKRESTNDPEAFAIGEVQLDMNRPEKSGRPENEHAWQYQGKGGDQLYDVDKS